MRRRALDLVLLAMAACDPGVPPAACTAAGDPAPSPGHTTCGSGPGWIAYAFARPDGSSPGLFLTRPDGRCAHKLTTDGAFYGAPAFFPGGRRLIYASTRSGLNRLYVRDLETGVETPIDTSYAFGSPPRTPVELAAAVPAVSPDGSTIAFEGSLPAYPGWSDVFTVPAAGGAVTRVTRDPVAATAPRWSGDGALLYVLSYRTGAPEIFSATPDGTSERQVTSGSALSSKFTLSGDGHALVYARFSTVGARAGPTELVALELASGAIRVISSANEADPAVDAATTSVAVSRRSPDGYELDLLDYATGEQRLRLTACPGTAFGAAFSR